MDGPLDSNTRTLPLHLSTAAHPLLLYPIIEMCPQMDQASFPHTPEDIFLRILFFSLYTGSEFSPYLQSDDVSAQLVDVRQRQASFVRSWFAVSKAVNVDANKLFWRSIFIQTPGEIYTILTILDGSPSPYPYDIGALCTCLEVRISDAYAPGALASLIRKTPNLKVFILRNTLPASNPPLRIRVFPIIEALATTSLALERIQFESQDEEPNVAETKRLLGSLKHLVTFHLDNVSIKPYPDDLAPLHVPAPSLQVLSIGSTARQYPWTVPFHRTGDLFRVFDSPTTLPNLAVVHIYQPSVRLRDFLNLFGGQLEELGFSCAEPWVAGPNNSHLMGLCPSLKHVTCVAPEGPVWAFTFPLPPHPTVESITCFYVNARPPSVHASGRVVLEILPSLVHYGGVLRRVSLVEGPSDIKFEEISAFQIIHRSLVSAGVQLDVIRLTL